MLQHLSLTAILSGLAVAYMFNSIWSVFKLYMPPDCPSDCIRNSLMDGHGGVRLLFLTTLKSQPTMDKDFQYIDSIDITNPLDEDESNFERALKIKLPKEITAKNGSSMNLAIFTLPIKGQGIEVKQMNRKWTTAIKSPDVTYSLVPLTAYQVREAETFNLLGDEPKTAKEPVSDRPVVHIKSKMFLSILTQDVALPRKEIPGEIYPLIRLKEPEKKTYLPLLFVNELSQRIEHLVVVNKTDTVTDITLVYTPISWGKMRIFLQFSAALKSMTGLGFSDKDIDEVKGIFADTNITLLFVTFVVSTFHLLFDVLAFKNDISFWSGRTNLTGLSTRTLVWRAFSQTIIFLYLLEENTSLLVLVPSGISVVIEFWKVTKAFGFDFTRGFYRKFEDSSQNSTEKVTESIDTEAMKYLSYVLYPLLIGGAAYSLLYTPHKSWYSWTINSMVNGVYAFGFLFMLPQLFVNYRLKSVAHLPMRAFMYKAFNTFIDDLFAFIITMPTAHRVACFRDDVVFIIYMYQRWLYPIDQTRCDDGVAIEETPSTNKPVTRSSKRLKAE